MGACVPYSMSAEPRHYPCSPKSSEIGGIPRAGADHDNAVKATYISPSDLRERWGFHTESIRRMIRAGRLPAYRFGRRLRVLLADVESYEAAQRINRYVTQPGGAA